MIQPRLRLALCLLLSPLTVAAQSVSLPGFEQVRAAHVSSDALLLDRNAQPLADLRLDPQVRRLDWVPLTSLSPAMRDALLTAEDRRFFQHKGVDWLAFAGAAWQNLWSSNKRGASTLTMQLAGLLDPALHLPGSAGGRRSLGQKWDQSKAALELEHKWSKAQILEAYLNLAPFRGDLQGIGAASELLFGLPASQLNTREASLLATLLRGPNAKPARVAQRACKLATNLGKPRLCPEITHLAETRLDAPRNLPRYHLAPQLARSLLHRPGQRLATLIDARLQGALLEILARQSDPQAAAVVLDNASGEVLAWIGAAQAGLPDGVSRHRPMAEWWWPEAAALALEQRQVTAASPLPLGWAVFDPYDARAATPDWQSLRPALAGHQIGAMLYLQHLAGREAWLERLRELGLENTAEQPDAVNQPSLLQLAAIWRSFAAGGQYLPARLLPGEVPTAPRRVWRHETAFILQDILATPGTGLWHASWQAYAIEDGSAVIVGHGEHRTLALATRNPAPQPLWLALLQASEGSSRAPSVPDGVVANLVSYDPPNEAPRREWFLRGTELNHLSVLADGRRARIRFPQAGETYTVATDPLARDRWALAADTSVALRWQLDDKPLGEGSPLAWQPQPGHHRLSIHAASGQLLDSVEFTIKEDAHVPPP